VNKEILLVEDDANDVFFMQRALRRAGITHTLQVASDGQNAVDYLNDLLTVKLACPPCLVFLDLKLPRLMGLEVLKWIRSQTSLNEMVVIVLSSSAALSDIQAAHGLGADSYLVKPACPHELSGMLVKVKRQWLDSSPSTGRQQENWSLLSGVRLGHWAAPFFAATSFSRKADAP
jgi:DNA-binding response OmpR family regulator